MVVLGFNLSLCKVKNNKEVLRSSLSGRAIVLDRSTQAHPTLSEKAQLMASWHWKKARKSNPAKQREQGVVHGGEGHFKRTCLQKRSLGLIRSVD